MAKTVKVIVLRTAGTNCDKETVFAFEAVGAEVASVHVNRLIAGEKDLSAYHILAIPGGFSYGDDIAAGKILANELRFKLRNQLEKFVAEGKLIIGICNGFQVLVKSGLLPGNESIRQEATLSLNDSAKFEDRWVYLRMPNVKCQINSQFPMPKCVWTQGLKETIYLPVAHGEGKFMAQDKAVLQRLKQNGQIVFQYCDADGRLAGYPANPNGSQEHIAGICDSTGRIFGLMPHPERHFLKEQHPQWTRSRGLLEHGDGYAIFKNGVDYVRANL
ncbi:MAG: phosphoribosylformylglycinamidine synthase I [Candidatus Omnitrophota bacterium]